MFEKMRVLVKNDTWDMVPRPFGKNTMECMWVYSVKHTLEGKVDRFKIRSVAKGYT
jgi:hypothetical protein